MEILQPRSREERRVISVIDRKSSTAASPVRVGMATRKSTPAKSIAAVRKLQAIHCGKKRLGFHLDRLRKQLPRTRSQNIRQWIVNLVQLAQWDNVDILVHGVSLSSRGG
jgi:hypothetical protein